MKKRTLIFIRILGALFLIGAIVIAYYAGKDEIINGAEVGSLFCFAVGAYFLIASKSSLKSWILTKIK